MLAAANRMGDSSDFREVTRRGRRAGAATVVVHVGVADAGSTATAPSVSSAPSMSSGATPPLVGLVVSKAVGNSVVRNRVKRRLRHQLRAHVDRLPGGSRLVVRALPAAATSSSADLAGDLARCLDRVGAAVPERSEVTS